MSNKSTTQSLTPGLVGKISFRADPDRLASWVGSGDVAVLATPMLVAGLEGAALQCVKAYLKPGQTTVGVHMDVSHTAATPEGMEINFVATLTKISENGKKLYFEAHAFDDAGPIGEAKHERVIVDKERFEENAKNRRKQNKLLS